MNITFKFKIHIDSENIVFVKPVFAIILKVQFANALSNSIKCYVCEITFEKLFVLDNISFCQVSARVFHIVIFLILSLFIFAQGLHKIIRQFSSLELKIFFSTHSQSEIIKCMLMTLAIYITLVEFGLQNVYRILSTENWNASFFNLKFPSLISGHFGMKKTLLNVSWIHVKISFRIKSRENKSRYVIHLFSLLIFCILFEIQLVSTVCFQFIRENFNQMSFVYD